MKDQKEKLAWLILACVVLAFVCGNISGYMIRNAQKQTIDTAKYMPLSSMGAVGSYGTIANEDSIVIDTLHSEIRK